MSFPRLTSINIKGYRPFRDFTAEVGALEVLVGANGSGKSSFFDFLKLIRNGINHDIPPGIVEDSPGQQVFNTYISDRIDWTIDILSNDICIIYKGAIAGPIGRINIPKEDIIKKENANTDTLSLRKYFVDNNNSSLISNKLLDISSLAHGKFKNNKLPNLVTMYYLREQIRTWRFYSSFKISYELLVRSSVIEQNSQLNEDCRNLSSVLHYFMTEHNILFEELQAYLRMVIPNFERLTVKARGGPGEVMAFWREKGVDADLSLADLSDGILRLLCWMVLCLHPKPPSLICIDEPDQGVHPRTLPVLAGLFQKASERTQIFLATHSSYFLSQFNLSEVAVMKKENGEAVFRKPKDSTVIKSMLEDFGTDEIGYLHWSDQLETFS
jgi:predicted ATPase